MLDPRMALIEKKYAKDTDTIPEFRSGDTVKVHVKVKEGNRERIQIFEGVVIGRQHLQHDCRQLLHLDLRHIRLPDGALVGAVCRVCRKNLVRQS